MKIHILLVFLLFVANVLCTEVVWQPETHSVNLASAENETFTITNNGFLFTGYASIDTIILYAARSECTTCTVTGVIVSFESNSFFSFEIISLVYVTIPNTNSSFSITLPFNYSGLSPNKTYAVFYGLEYSSDGTIELYKGTSNLRSGVTLTYFNVEPSITPAFRIPRQALTEAEYQYSFSSWMRGQNKSYTSAEFLLRYTIFKENLDYINLHNSGNSSYTLGENEFTDLTLEEFSKTRLMSVPRWNVTVDSKGDLVAFLNNTVHVILGATGNILNTTLGTIGGILDGLFPRAEKRLPQTVDWRKQGIVTPPKDQQSCGSCYAFGTIGVIESAIAQKTGNLVDLSEQQVVDCSYKVQGGMNGGCNGGHEVVVMDWVAKKGLVNENTYSYKSGRSQTHYSCQRSSGTYGKGLKYRRVAPNDEKSVAEAVAQYGTLVASISGENREFQMYRGGIYDNPRCSKEVDHVVSIVGYGSENGKDFWIVKNSWGTTWGENGFGRVRRGTNMCGIVSDSSWSITV